MILTQEIEIMSATGVSIIYVGCPMWSCSSDWGLCKCLGIGD